MKRILTGLILMALSSQVIQAQTDLHSHMIPDSYLEAVKAHGMEMDEGFPIPGWHAAAHGLIPEDILSNNAKSLFNIQ